MNDSSIRFDFVMHTRIIIFLSICVATIISLHSVRGLFDQWMKFDGSYSHGFLLCAYCGYLLWEKPRFIKPRIQPQPSIFGVFCFLVLSLSALLTQIMFIEVLGQLLLPLIILSLFWSFLGLSLTIKLMIPVILLFFSVSVWDYAIYVLQLITVFWTNIFLSLSGIDFSISETFVTLPGLGVFEVAAGCSGLRYFLIASVLSLIIADQWLYQWRSRLKILCLGVFLGLLSNWIRVSVIIYIGHVTEMKSSLIEDHEMFGWVLFAIIMTPFIIYARKLSDSDFSVREQKSEASEPMICSSPMVKHPTKLFSVVITTFVCSWLMPSFESIPSRQVDLSLQSMQWTKLPLKQVSPVGSQFVSPPQYFNGLYSHQSGTWLYLSYYGYPEQAPGSELVFYSNRFYDKSAWIPHPVDVPNTENAKWHIRRLEERIGEQRQYLVAATYVAGNYQGSNRLEVKLNQLLAWLNSDPEQFAGILALRCRTECDEELYLLIETMNPALSAMRRVARHYEPK